MGVAETILLLITGFLAGASTVLAVACLVRRPDVTPVKKRPAADPADWWKCGAAMPVDTYEQDDAE